jgi:putative transposase
MPWKEPHVMEIRTEFAVLAMKRERTFRSLCASYGISPKTGYKWVQRYQAQGRGGMGDSSRRPQKSPTQLPETSVCEMIRLKVLHKHWGPKKIQTLYGREHGEAPSLSSFQRVLEKSGLVEKRPRRKVRSGSRRLEGVAAAKAPNEVWTVDFKGWWFTSSSKIRCQPLTVRDEYSRFILGLDALQTTCTAQVQRCFESLFKMYGMPKAIRSDNGQPFAAVQAPLGLSRLSIWWLSLGIRLHRSRPGHPQDNGAHERMHRDICFEIEAYAKGNHRDHQAVFDMWREEYNHVRPHEALGQRSPADVYKLSKTPYPGKRVEWEYPGQYLVRKVNSCGRIWIENQVLFLSHSLTGYWLGLKSAADNKLEIYLAEYYLGTIDLPTRSILWASPKDASQLN